jgi:hypothetical protein
MSSQFPSSIEKAMSVEQSEEKPYFPFWKTPQIKAELIEFMQFWNKIRKEQLAISLEAAMKKFVLENPDFFNDGKEKIFRQLSL